MSRSDIDSILKQCKRALREAYGDRFAGLVLYGSMARGDYDAESDIDLLVLLRGNVRTASEIDRIDEALEPVQLESGRLISPQAVSVEDYREGRWSFLRNAAREGTRV
ncbi:MAG: nucleotidyltransferase domain-containing protein [Planctomycetota bacterium]